MIELEHLIGQSVLPQAAAIHPNGEYLYSIGANLVSSSLSSLHRQNIIRPIHDAPITCLDLSGSGDFVASAQEGDRSNVYVWSYETQEVLYSLEEHDLRVQAVAFSLDEKLLATLGGEEDGKLILWDMSNGMIVSSSARVAAGSTCLVHGGMVRDVKRRDTHKYLLCTAGKSGVVLWELDPFTGLLECFPAIAEARGTTSRQVTAVAFALDKETLYAASTSGDFLVVSLKTRRIVATVPVAKAPLEAVVVCRQGLFIACADSTLKIFDHNCQFRREIRLVHPAIAMRVSPDASELLLVTVAGSTLRLNLTSFDSLVLSESHTDAVVAVCFSEEASDRFATASADGTLKVWDIADYMVVTTACARKEQARGARPLCLVFSLMLISGWSDGFICSHDCETGTPHWFIENAHTGGVTALALSHNRKFVLSGGMSGELRLWELRSRELISHLKFHTQRVTGIVIFEDDSRASSCSKDRSIVRWELQQERRVHSLEQRMGGINGIVLSKDLAVTVSVGQDRKLVFWDNDMGLARSLSNATSVLRAQFLDGELDEGIAIDMSHCGKFLATGGTAGVLRIWAYPSGVLLMQGRGHNSVIQSLVFSPNDKQLVSAAADGGIVVWYIDLQSLSTHTGSEVVERRT